MRPPISRLVRPLLVGALLLGFTGKQAFDFNDTTWTFSAAKLNFSGKAKKLGHLKGKEVDAAQVVLHADGTWELDYAGDPVSSGTWSVKDAFSKIVTATADQTGDQQLFDSVTNLVEAKAAALGTPVNATLDTVKADKFQLVVKADVKHGTATAKLVTSCTLTGHADGGPFTNEPAVCKAKIVATSDAVPLASIEP